jgi:hypothetical protein
MGKRQPHLAGEPLVDASGHAHPGLIPIGIPVQGQETTDYDEFRRRVSQTDPNALRYLGIMIYGTRKKVSRVVGRYSLLRAKAQD